MKAMLLALVLAFSTLPTGRADPAEEVHARYGRSVAAQNTHDRDAHMRSRGLSGRCRPPLPVAALRPALS